MEYVFLTLAAICFCVFIALGVYTSMKESDLSDRAAPPVAISLMLSLVLAFVFVVVAGSITKQKDATCPECGNVAYSKYCDECGYHMDKTPTCPSCGSHWDSAYCGDCGTAMPPQT